MSEPLELLILSDLFPQIRASTFLIHLQQKWLCTHRHSLCDYNMVYSSRSPKYGSYQVISSIRRRLALKGQGSLSFSSTAFTRTISGAPHRLRPSNAINGKDEEDESKEEVTTSETESRNNADGGVNEIREEIREAMKARKEREGNKGGGGGGDLWRGVVEETREIEWPAFGKVVGTTGVVLGVIAGSSVVLLTVNAVLAELSDRVFTGRGVQDFFS